MQLKCVIHGDILLIDTVFAGHCLLCRHCFSIVLESCGIVLSTGELVHFNSSENKVHHLKLYIDINLDNIKAIKAHNNH